MTNLVNDSPDLDKGDQDIAIFEPDRCIHSQTDYIRLLPELLQSTTINDDS